MNIRRVFHLISFMVLFIALAIGVSCGVSFLFKDEAGVRYGLAWSGLLTGAIGGLLWMATRGNMDLTRKDGFGVVALGWLTVGCVGAIPYMMTGVIPHPIDAFFETLSGFTTTGASILTQIDGLPYGVLFWRSLTQWLGGMGVLLMCVAILPFLGVGGMQIYRAEMPGPSKDRLTPRIENTAKLLWGVYALLTFSQTILLKLGGMTWFDALNHSFTTLSTGGFSTHTASLAAYASPFIQVVVIVFMFLSGVNFSLHFRALRGEPISYFQNPECRLYFLVWLISGLLLTGSVWGMGNISASDSVIQGFFQGTSLITTTGFANTDYDVWSALAKKTLFLLMFTGACAGSTAGGIKIVRVFVAIKEVGRQIKLFMQPQAVLKVKLGKKPITQDIVASITSFFMAFLFTMIIGTMLMSVFTPDIETAVSSVIAALGNVGPGFSAVGPARNYAAIPYPGKFILSILMLMGRLELFTVLIIFLPRFWKR